MAPTFNFFKLHGWMMWASWGLLSLIQIGTNRYLKHCWKLNMWIHRLAGTTMLFITFGFGIYGIKRLNWEIDSSTPHAVLGVICLSLVGIIFIAGIVARLLLEKKRWATKLLLRVKMCHRVRNFVVYSIDTWFPFDFVQSSPSHQWSSFIRFLV